MIKDARTVTGLRALVSDLDELVAEPVFIPSTPAFLGAVLPHNAALARYRGVVAVAVCKHKERIGEGPNCQLSGHPSRTT